MPVGPFSRYRGLSVLVVIDATRGSTRSLPIRRLPSPSPSNAFEHRFHGFETADLLARRYYGREELYWHLLDANDGRDPASFAAGETINVPSLELATRVVRTG